MTSHRLLGSLHSTAHLAAVSAPHDQMRLALAIADSEHLKSLLADCTPALASYPHIHAIRANVSVPISEKKVVDAILQFEEVRCVLVEGSPFDRYGTPTSPLLQGMTLAELTRCESEMQTLASGLSLAQAIALLTQAGFSSPQVNDIIHLPSEAWHKSWWASQDAAGAFSVPFLRTLRTRRYIDGTLTLQYRDYFPQDKPPCFTSQSRQVVVAIASSSQRFSKTLEHINRCRDHCQIKQALLICDSISDLEAQGLVNQGISIYATQSLRFPVPSNCAQCANGQCPMQGRANSPIVTCRQFSREQGWG